MLLVGVLSQKGGVSKTCLTASLLVSYTNAGWQSIGIDGDTSQKSLTRWNDRRKANEVTPELEVISGLSLSDLGSLSARDIAFYDGAPHATNATEQVAVRSTLCLLPTSTSIMDLEPQVALAHELTSNGVTSKKIMFVLTKVAAVAKEVDDARLYIEKAGFEVCPGCIPDRTSFRKGFISGFSFTEASFHSLKAAAEEVVQGIANKINNLTN